MNEQMFELLTPELSALYFEYLKLRIKTAQLIDLNPCLRDLLDILEDRNLPSDNKVFTPQPSVWKNGILGVSE